jgi:hypothetical protein
MPAMTLEQMAAELAALRREGEALAKDDPRALSEHLAKLRTLAERLNAHLANSPPRE